MSVSSILMGIKNDLVAVEKKGPQHPILHLQLGIVVWKSGDQDKALASVQKALELLKCDSRRFILRQQAKLLRSALQVYSRQEPLPTSVLSDELKEIMKEYRDSSSSIFWKQINTAISLLSLKGFNYDVSTKHLEAILDKDPKDAEAWANLGLVYLHTNDIENASSCFQLALSKDSRNVDAMMNYAYVLLQKSLISESVELLRLAYSYQPTRLDVCCNLITVYYILDRKEDAKDIIKVLASYHLSSDWPRQLWLMLGALPIDEEFISELSLAMSELQFPNLDRAYWKMIQSKYEREENKSILLLKEALQLFKEYASTGHESPDCLNKMGLISLQLGDFDDAIRFFELAVIKSSGDQAFWCNLLFAHHICGSNLEEICTKFKGLQDLDWSLLVNLGNIFADAGHFELSENALRIVCERIPHKALGLNNLSILYIRTGRYELAKKTLQDCRTRFPDDQASKHNMCQLERILILKQNH